MHSSVLDWIRSSIGIQHIAGKSVLEVGSYDVNGSPRSVILPLGPKSYIGVDNTKGPGVDEIADSSQLVSKFGGCSFDVVISTEMLEHAKEWKVAINQMKGVLKPGGLMIVTARGPGMGYHPYPNDYWRFTINDFRKIFSDMEIISLEKDTGLPGVMIEVRKPWFFNRVDLDVINVASIESK